MTPISWLEIYIFHSPKIWKIIAKSVSVEIVQSFNAIEILNINVKIYKKVCEIRKFDSFLY